MMKFVENPNLPVCADIVIIGEKYCKILQNGIKSLGINALFMPDKAGETAVLPSIVIVDTESTAALFA